MAAACTTTTANTAAPTTFATPGATATSTAPPRPRVFDLADVNPCDLIPAAARPALTLDRPPSGPQAVDSARSCVFPTSSLKLAGFGVFVDSTKNAEGAVGSGKNTVRTEVVDGFAATLAVPPGGQSCEAFLDVNDGQYVSVQATGLGELTSDELCTIVQPGITVVLDTLAKLQPQ